MCNHEWETVHKESLEQFKFRTSRWERIKNLNSAPNIQDNKLGIFNYQECRFCKTRQIIVEPRISEDLYWLAYGKFFPKKTFSVEVF